MVMSNAFRVSPRPCGCLLTKLVPQTSAIKMPSRSFACSSRIHDVGQQTDLNVFAKQRFEVGGGVVVEPGSDHLWHGIRQNGLYRYEPSLGRRVRLLGCVLGPASKFEYERADAIFAKLTFLLDLMGLVPMLAGHLGVPPSLQHMLDVTEARQVHAAVVFGTRESRWMQGLARHEFFERAAPPLAHRALHWIDLSHWRDDDIDFYRLGAEALALAAKLGHTPYVLSNSALEQSICSINAHHVRRMDGAHRLATDMRFLNPSGEVEGSWSFEAPSGQDDSRSYWESALSPRNCAGRRVAIHRKGRFTDAEQQFLKGHAPKVGAEDNRFDLVEIEHTIPNAHDVQVDGSFRRLSEREGLLQVCGDQRLFVRVLNPQHQTPEIAAEQIFHLSTVGHFPTWSEPRKQYSPSSAEVATTFLASQSRSMSPMAWRNGSQQYWL